MDTVQEIERAIDALTPQQREQLYEWLDRHHPQSIDEQLKSDLEAGRIDSRINRGVRPPGRKNPAPLAPLLLHRANARARRQASRCLRLVLDRRTQHR